jgi:hypothetical protein
LHWEAGCPILKANDSSTRVQMPLPEAVTSS